jgi:hypothetical protein
MSDGTQSGADTLDISREPANKGGLSKPNGADESQDSSLQPGSARK